MKLALSLAALAIVTTTMMLPANAQMNIDGQEANMQARITAGIQNGLLTNREAAQLNQRLSRINFIESRMRANTGGGLNMRERTRLQGELNNLNVSLNNDLATFERRPSGWVNQHHGFGFGWHR